VHAEGRIVNTVLEFKVQLESTTCPECGVEHAMPSHMLTQKRNNRGSVYCPNGHSAGWSETEAEKLRKQLAAKDRELEQQRVNLELARKMRDTAENSARAIKGVLAKVKQRVGQGSCPCCRRHFTNLRRHMTSKHPGYAKSEATP
jgi:ssDNA-binding Zn-finger/Zn-ribbon topoisomerase 1